MRGNEEKASYSCRCANGLKMESSMSITPLNCRLSRKGKNMLQKPGPHFRRNCRPREVRTSKLLHRSEEGDECLRESPGIIDRFSRS
jgi:hypothetical protein